MRSFLKCFSEKRRLTKTIGLLKKRIHFLEEAKSKTEDYLNNIIRLTPANIYWKDLDCVILGGNLSHAQNAGYSDPKEVVGKTEYDFVWREHAEAIMKNDKHIMESGIGAQLEEIGYLTDGKLHTFLTNKEPLRDKNNNIIGIIGVSTDITHFKELQEQLMQAKTLAAEAAVKLSNSKAITEEEIRKTVMILVGDIVHDLRTPISVIKTITDILEKILPEFIELADMNKAKAKILSPNAWNYLAQMTPIHEIKDAVTMMNEFIDTTLTELATAHKTLSSGLTAEQLTPNSSTRIIENTVKAYPFSDSEKKKVRLQINYEFSFMGNSILSMKILFNLIKNALEQMRLKGQGEITISTGQEEHYNLISIKDTAGGAPSEVVSNFFNGYFTTKDTGTGIGLAFCKKTMHSFGGDIICHSICGESMEFILKFPIKAE